MTNYEMYNKICRPVEPLGWSFRAISILGDVVDDYELSEGKITKRWYE